MNKKEQGKHYQLWKQNTGGTKKREVVNKKTEKIGNYVHIDRRLENDLALSCKRVS